ncbi:MAG: glycosyltransferase family 4 protein [Microgenomates group bacterium]
MNILFVSALLPYPLHSGGQVRMYNLLKALSKKHDITLMSFIRNEEERALATHISFVKDVHMIMRGKGRQAKYIFKALGNFPLLLATYDNRMMQQKIKEELARKKYDLVHIEPFYVFPSLPPLSVPMIVSEHNVEYAIYLKNAEKIRFPLLKPLAYFDAVKIKIWEEIVWQRARIVTAVSEDDAKIISASTKKETPVIPNGVDTKTFTYVGKKFDKKNPTFLFVGNFLWAPNLEAVRQLLTTIWLKILLVYPEAKLTIVGKHFPSGLRKYILPSVHLEEYVEDIRDAFAASDVLLAPMGIGGGTKFKILEAMATGTLVVTTKEGRMGIVGTSGKEFYEAATPEEFGSAVNTIYAHPETAKTITKNARKMVETMYDWQAIAEKLDVVWKGAV